MLRMAELIPLADLLTPEQRQYIEELIRHGTWTGLDPVNRLSDKLVPLPLSDVAIAQRARLDHLYQNITPSIVARVRAELAAAK
jgi:hypothetical protein